MADSKDKSYKYRQEISQVSWFAVEFLEFFLQEYSRQPCETIRNGPPDVIVPAGRQAGKPLHQPPSAATPTMGDIGVNPPSLEFSSCLGGLFCVVMPFLCPEAGLSWSRATSAQVRTSIHLQLLGPAIRASIQKAFPSLYSVWL